MSDTKLHILENTVLLLENTIPEFEKILEKPSMVRNENGEYYPRFLNPNSGHFQLLMAVKIVSTLNGILCLLKNDLIQEVAVLVRIVDECSAKICCIQEAHFKQKLTAEQKKIIDGYFEYDIKSLDDLKNKDKWWINMDKVFASHARFLSEGTPNKNVSGILENIKTIYEMFHGYTHGFYTHIMELYDPSIQKYRMNGVSNPHFRDPIIWTVASIVLRSLNVFSIIASQLGLEELRLKLIENRDIFMKSEAYKREKKDKIHIE